MTDRLEADVRRALRELSEKLPVSLELRSGESLRGEFVGMDGDSTTLRTTAGEEVIEIDEIIGVYLEGESPGPE